MVETTSEDLFLISNLSPKRTGLPFVVWISPKGGATHDVRVQVSRSPKAMPSEFITVTVRPTVQVLGLGTITGRELEMLTRWIELNRDVLIKFWDGRIEYTEDVLTQLQSI